MRFSSVLLTLSLALQTTSAAAQVAYRAATLAKVRGQPYGAYSVVDALGRTVSFYLSESTSQVALPLVVYVHGSGHGSHFARVGDRVAPANGHATLVDAARGRARVLIVEKPGVTLFDNVSSPSREAFRQEHTLDRWVEAVVAAASAASHLPGVDPERVLVVGHSEGGLVASRVARRLPSVSHIGVLAGGGPSQLFDLRLLARTGDLFASVSPHPSEREAFVLAQWDSIVADPESADRMFLGHPYRRWATFLSASPIAELRESPAQVFLAQGAEDRAVSRESFDALVSELAGAARRPVAILVPDADHSFAVTDASGARQDGWLAILSQLLDWYLESRRAAG